MYRLNNFNSTIGGGIFRYDYRKNNSFNLSEVNRENVYMYTNSNYAEILNLTLGLSYDSYDTYSPGRKDNINPKIGLQWNINNHIRLRAAWFETTKSQFIAQQSLEPTQIAGFNQFYDDANGTKARRIGIGFDTYVSEKLFGGFEISERNLSVPELKPNSTQTHNEELINKQKETMLSSYLYWIINSNWVIKGEFNFEDNSQSKNSSNNIREISTLRSPISVNYYHPSGFFSRFLATYVEQIISRGFDRPQPRINDSGKSTFFIFDANLGFRLPNRYGFINLEIKNIFDKEMFFINEFFYTSEPRLPRYIPGRIIQATLTFNF